MAYMSKTHRAGNSEEYLFRPISSSENRKRLVSVNKPISYSAYRDSFKKSFPDIVPDISRFSSFHEIRRSYSGSQFSRLGEKHSASRSLSFRRSWKHLSGLKPLNLCPSELKPFLLLSSMGLADGRAHASKCCFVCSVVQWRQNM